MNKLKIISLYEKIINDILCFIMKCRIKFNFYNKNIDDYQPGRKITFEETFKNNKFDNKCWKLEQACWGRYVQNQFLIIKENGYKIENENLQFFYNPDKGYWKGWEGEGDYYFNTASFMTKENQNIKDKGFYQKYGRFEIKCKLKSGYIGWPAFWLLSNRPSNNDSNLTPILPEIDIFEGYEKDKKTGLAFTLHYGSNYNTSDKKQEFSVIRNIDFGKDYWLISIEWTDKYIKWYLNNHLVKVSRFSKIPEIHRPNYECYMILNEAIFPRFVNEIKNITKSIEGMNVDWIRVYK